MAQRPRCPDGSRAPSATSSREDRVKPRFVCIELLLLPVLEVQIERRLNDRVGHSLQSSPRPSSASYTLPSTHVRRPSPSRDRSPRRRMWHDPAMVVNLAHVLRRAALAHPRLLALARGERRLSDYATLARDVAALAGALRGRLALRPDDRVALVMGNGPAYVELLFACWHAGLAAVPINAKLHPREVDYIVADARAAAAFVTAEHGDTDAALVIDVDSAE